MIGALAGVAALGVVYVVLAMLMGAALGRMARDEDRDAEDDRQMAYLDGWRRRNRPVLMLDDEIEDFDMELARCRSEQVKG